MRRALVVGGVSWNRIIHLDRLPDGAPQTVHARRSYEALGGTGAGKAWNLVALGWEVDLVAAVGDDRAGASVRRELDALGVRLHAVDDPAGTEEHTNLMAPSGERVSIYTNASSPAVAIDVAEVLRLAVAADVVCVNILEHCRPLLEPLRGAGVRFWTDLHDHDGVEAHHQEFADAATSLQVSSDRLPGWRSWGVERLAAGADLVVVTHGAGGADVADAGGWWHVDADPVPVIDTNGAGDAFWAGFVTARARGAAPADALATAVAAAARCVGTEGLGPSVTG